MYLVRSWCRPFYPLDDHSIKKIARRVIAPSPERVIALPGCGVAWRREPRPGGEFPQGNRSSRFFQLPEEVFPRRGVGRRCGGGLRPRSARARAAAETAVPDGTTPPPGRPVACECRIQSAGRLLRKPRRELRRASTLQIG